MDPYEVPKGSVIVNGKAWPCAAPVKHWADTGLEFKPGQGARVREAAPDLVVLHHTGGEGDAAGVYRVLNERKLGVEFVIDRSGVIYQMADPLKTGCFHAGTFNRRSVGIEIVSCGAAPLPKSAGDRGTYVDKVNGVSITFANFYPAQITAAIALCDTLTESIGIPRTFMAGNKTCSAEALAAFSGLVGHFHLTTQKIDPGTDIFAQLTAAGYSS